MEQVELYPLSDKFKDIISTLLSSKITFLMLEGAVRSGKSFTANYGRLLYIEKVLKKNSNILVSGRTRGTRKQNVLSEWEILLDVEFLRRNDASGEYYIIPLDNFENKRIYVRGRDKQTDFKKIQGMTLDFWYRDERTNHHKSFFDMAISRLSKKTSKAIFTCNPDSPHHYIKTDFIDKSKTDEEFGKYFKSWSFLMTENPSLDQGYKDRTSSSYEGVFYDRYIRGMWVLAEGLIYDGFNRKENVKKYDKREIDILKKNGTIYIGVDYGTLNATVFLKFIKYNDKFYLIEEYHHSGRDTNKQKTSSDYCKDMIKFIDNDIIKRIYIDPSARGLKADMTKHSIKRIVSRKNEVLAGIRKTQNYISNKDLIIYDNCKETLKEFETYSWDEKASLKGEDIPLKVNDHTMDRLRYVIFTTPDIKYSKSFQY